MNIDGLNDDQIKRLSEFFVMANDKQLVQIRIYLSNEIDRRDYRRNFKKWESKET